MDQRFSILMLNSSKEKAIGGVVPIGSLYFLFFDHTRQTFLPPSTTRISNSVPTLTSWTICFFFHCWCVKWISSTPRSIQYGNDTSSIPPIEWCKSSSTFDSVFSLWPADEDSIFREAGGVSWTYQNFSSSVGKCQPCLHHIRTPFEGLDTPTELIALGLYSPTAFGKVVALVSANTIQQVHPWSILIHKHVWERPSVIGILNPLYKPLQYPVFVS